MTDMGEASPDTLLDQLESLDPQARRVEDFVHRLLGELAMFIELVEWATPLDSSGNSVGVTELAPRHPNPAAEVCPTAATAHLRSSLAV